MTHQNDRHVAPVMLVHRIYDLGHSAQRNPRIYDFTLDANAKKHKEGDFSKFDRNPAWAPSLKYVPRGIEQLSDITLRVPFIVISNSSAEGFR